MTTKLPKLPDTPFSLWQHDETGRTSVTTEPAAKMSWRGWRQVSDLFTAAQTQAYAREAVADALRPGGDNAEHVVALERLAAWFDHPATTVALAAALAALSAPKAEAVEGGYTYGHCESHKQAGGCQLHNLQCNFPDCDRRPITPVRATQPESGGQGEVKPLTDTEFALAQVRGKLAWLEQCVRDAGCEIDYSEDEGCVYNRRAEDAEAKHPPAPASVAVTEAVEYRMWDSQWVNVVNHASAYDGWSTDDAVSHAVRMTEQAMAKNIADGRWPRARNAAALAQGGKP